MGPARNRRRFGDEIAVERAELLGKNVGMGSLGKPQAIDNFCLWLGAAILCTLSVHALAQAPPPQPSSPPVFQYQPTMQDVDPGIDHGNSDENVPYEFKKQMVFHRSQQPPGTVIIDTQERHLYLIQDPTHAMR